MAFFVEVQLATLTSFVALALASAHPPTTGSKSTPVSGSIQGLFNADDYPAEALDKNEQGDVGVLVKVDASGVISDCIIEKSSGSAVLDTRTCDVIRERAKFKPATGPNGRAVASDVRNTASWRIAQDMPEPSDPWAATVIMSYGANGDPLSCRVELEGAKKPAADSRPGACSPSPLPARLAQLGTVSRLIIQQKFATGPMPALQLGSGDVLIGRAVLALEIDPAGKITSCTVSEASAEMRNADGCTLISGKTFTPRLGPTGQPVAFSGTLAFSNVVHLEEAAAATTAQ